MFSAEGEKAYMRPLLAFMLSCSLAVATSSLNPLLAQDLSPRAYVITPLHANAVIMGYSFFHGSVLFEGAAPDNRCNRNIQRAESFLLSFLQLSGPLGQHECHPYPTRLATFRAT